MSSSTKSKKADRKILIVEDEEHMARLLDKTFQQYGFDVHLCFDGEASTQELAKDSFDAVLVDLRLPKKNGFEILQEKKLTKNCDAPAFVMTSMGVGESFEKSMDLGTVQYFSKMENTPKQMAFFVMEALDLDTEDDTVTA